MLRKVPWATLNSAWLFILAGALTACGADWDITGGKTYNNTGLPDDTTNVVTYPVGPYDKSVGSVVENHSFATAFLDKATWCKSADKLSLDNNEGVTSLSFLDILKGSSLCPSKRKQFLWITITTGT